MTEIPAETSALLQDLLNVAPVNVEEVARRLGLAIYQQPLAAGVSGVLLRQPSFKTASGFAILVNPNEAYVRQRFTAAHEIGHFVLHKDQIGDRVEDNYLLRANGLSTLIEQQANRFAADLLMPFPLINRLFQEGVTTVSALARRLQVSEIAMGIRLGHPT